MTMTVLVEPGGGALPFTVVNFVEVEVQEGVMVTVITVTVLVTVTTTCCREREIIYCFVYFLSFVILMSLQIERVGMTIFK